MLAARCYATESSLFLQPFVDALLPCWRPGCRRTLRRARRSARPDALRGCCPSSPPCWGRLRPSGRSPEIELRRAFEGVTRVLHGLAAGRPRAARARRPAQRGSRHRRAAALPRPPRHRPPRPGRRDGPRGERAAPRSPRSPTSAGGSTSARSTRPRSRSSPPRRPPRAGRGDPGPHRWAHAVRRRDAPRLAGGRGRACPSRSSRPCWPGCGARARRRRSCCARARCSARPSIPPSSPACSASRPGWPCSAASARPATRLLREAGRSYEFANDLVQEVIYATTPEPVRTAHHRQAADLLTRTPEAVARHAAASGDRPRAARAFLLAGERRAGAGMRCRMPRPCSPGPWSDADAAELVARARLARGRAREAQGAFAPGEEDYRAALAPPSHGRRPPDRDADAARARRSRHDRAGPPGRGVHSAAAAKACASPRRWATGEARPSSSAGSPCWPPADCGSSTRSSSAGARCARAGRQARVRSPPGSTGSRPPIRTSAELRAARGHRDELEPLLRGHGDLQLLHWTVFESAFPPSRPAEWEALEGGSTTRWR